PLLTTAALAARLLRADARPTWRREFLWMCAGAAVVPAALLVWLASRDAAAALFHDQFVRDARPDRSVFRPYPPLFLPSLALGIAAVAGLLAVRAWSRHTLRPVALTLVLAGLGAAVVAIVWWARQEHIPADRLALSLAFWLPHV